MHLNLARALTSILRRSCWLTLPLAIAAIGAFTQARAAEILTLTNVKQIWQVPQEIKSLPNPVSMDFTVNFYDPYWRVMWGEDNGLTFFVNSV